jgi:hypothetical protein
MGDENARRLVRLLTTTKWINDPKPLTRREQSLYVKACTRPGHEWREMENAREVASWRYALARTHRGVIYGTNMWTDTAGHESDFGYIAYDLDQDGRPDQWHTVLDCPLTLALEAMDNHLNATGN